MDRRLFLAQLAAAATSVACVPKHNSVGKGRSVLVIGAGMAGLAAARALTRYGFEVRVLEGRSRIGGRVWTDRSALGHPLDCGASWIHEAVGNPIRKLAREFGAQTRPTDYLDAFAYDVEGRALSYEGVLHLMTLWDQMTRNGLVWARKQVSPVSARDALNDALGHRNLSARERRWMLWRSRAAESEMGEDLSRLNAIPDPRESGFTGSDRLFPHGYDAIPKGLAEGLTIELEQRVTRVAADESGVKVTTSRDTFEAERAVVTLPLGVMKAGHVTFEPELPARKREAIEALGMGTLNKVALKFPRVFWPEGREFLFRLQPKGFHTFLDWNTCAGEPTLIAFQGGSFARGLEDDSDEAIAGRVVDDLSDMLGERAPEPVAVKVTRWTADELASGSYSHRPPGVSGREYDVLAEPVGRIHFAGEATSRRYPATVHGAYLSGLREAERIAES